MVIVGDCLEVMKGMADDSVDLVVTSPPYESARKYGELNFSLSGQEWVDWAVERYLECVRISRGLVAWVVEGRTRKFQWSATPALLMADLHRAGVKLRKPPIYARYGIAGSGGPDYWRNDYELVVCASKGRLPWSENCATGSPPKYGPGGAMSHRTASGKRVGRKKYTPPAIANPGNIIRCKVGRGHMGSDLAHENDAPFPESLVEPFIKCFCPPDGTVLDCFCGSGTTLAVAERLGRKAIGIDIRPSQAELTERRIGQAAAT
jgi:hypothetical protein